MVDGFLDGVSVPASKDRRDAVYFRAMDSILYLRQDSAYVADRIDEWLTLLLDPQTQQPIGVKLKGFRNIYLQMKEVRKLVGIDLEKQVPFRSFISLAESIAIQIGDTIVDDTARRVQYDAYKIARDIVGPAVISADEIRLAVAA
jgi:hypothetical protein